LILWGVGTFTLGIVGERGMAAITSVRRQGGARADGRSVRYTYAISYTFNLPDGTSVDGFTTKIGDSVYLKVTQPRYVTPVRYLSAVPWINALEEDTKPHMGQLVLIIAGGFLIYAMNRM
ncbi:MAG: hypothetical protein Q8S19_08405, partial [Bacillota bacterium]|nr:hypothetical protein [Bacillota bacterium]